MASPTKKIFNAPMNLIRTEKRADGKYYPAVNNEVLEKVGQVEEKLVVVPVIGPYRTGKSYLLNLILQKASKTSAQVSKAGFSVGHKSDPETKGVWIYIVDHPNLPNHKLALLDTEGIGDTGKGDQQHDAMLFMLMCLVSNLLIHNGMKTIDETSFEKFRFLAEMSKHVIMKVKTSKNYEDIIFPELVYLVRDCQVQLEAKGKPITPDEYLENGLEVGADEDKTTERAKTRRAIKDNFKQRKCFIFDQPAYGRKKLSNLHNLADDDLNKDFVDDVKKLCEYLFSRSEAGKMLNGRCLNGRQFAKLLNTYVDAYRNGEVPNVSSAMESLKTHENKKALEKAEHKYDSAMERFGPDMSPEMSWDIIKEHEDITETITKWIVKEVILEKGEEDGFLRKLEVTLIAKRNKIVRANDIRAKEMKKHDENVRYYERKADVIGTVERITIGGLDAASRVAIGGAIVLSKTIEAVGGTAVACIMTRDPAFPPLFPKDRQKTPKLPADVPDVSGKADCPQTP